MLSANENYTRRIRAILGENACIGYMHATGMLAAFLTHDFDQRPYVIAGDEEGLLKLAAEKKRLENKNANTA